jgi:hypothetical protein
LCQIRQRFFRIQIHCWKTRKSHSHECPSSVTPELHQNIRTNFVIFYNFSWFRDGKLLQSKPQTCVQQERRHFQSLRDDLQDLHDKFGGIFIGNRHCERRQRFFRVCYRREPSLVCLQSRFEKVSDNSDRMGSVGMFPAGRRQLRQRLDLLDGEQLDFVVD